MAGSIEDFQNAIKILREKITIDEEEERVSVSEEQDIKDAEVMSNPDNWCCVHTTRYMPRYDADGNMIITSLAMATDCEKARQTVHFALNHVVESHNDGNWDDCPYVILTPYQDVVAKNGDPAGLCLTDTYFSTDIDTGLVIPKDSAYLIQPSDNLEGQLWEIGEHGAVYKVDHFTDDQIQQVLQLLPPKELKHYNRLLRGDLNEGEIRKALGTDPMVKRWYENSSNKQEFLSGLMYEDRMVILTRFLRDFVTRLVMKEKGFEYIDNALNRAGGHKYIADSHVGKAIEKVATSKKIPSGTGAHYWSPYGAAGIQREMEEFAKNIAGIVNEKNMDDLFMRLYKYGNSGSENLVSLAYATMGEDFQYDYYDQVYEAAFQKFKEARMEEYNRHTKEYNDEYGYPDLLVQQYETIEDFDPKYAKALKRQIENGIKKLHKWRASMEHNPKFQKLLQKWKDYVEGNYTDIDEFLKPSIEQQFAQSQQMMRPREM